MVVVIAAAAGLSSLTLPASNARARSRAGVVAPKRTAVAAAVSEAARRFGVPVRWIYAVIGAESGGDPQAISAAGAMGLMQLMPATWARERDRLQLGPDPFDPRDNILAGADYLRAMYARYGAIGMLAAYNAGPGRYEAYRNAGRALPAATLAYVRRLAPSVAAQRSIDAVSDADTDTDNDIAVLSVDVRHPPVADLLFAASAATSRPVERAPLDAPSHAAVDGWQSPTVTSHPTPPTGSRAALDPQGDGLFAALGRPSS